jgi:aminomethyltransferase
LSTETLQKKTPLYALHLAAGGRMVPFAGYEMPVQYRLGIMKEHLHTRHAAGLFDVSHMGQLILRAPNIAASLEKLVPADVEGLAEGRMRYSQFTNEAGGILDDLMISNAGDHLALVVNAACKEADIAHLQANLGADCTIENLADKALLALQGPGAVSVLARFCDEAFEKFPFMSFREAVVAGVKVTLSRAGYTGEDGFEISVDNAKATELAEILVAEADVELIGLGARDSLRLEAGLCLYGHDIDETISPVEAGLVWSIGKRRREEGGFAGDEIILRQLAEGVERKRVGLKPDGRAPLREHAKVTDTAGAEVGQITSGGFGPSIAGPVAMGYVRSDLAEAGTTLSAELRGKPVQVTVSALPFVPAGFFRMTN